MLPARSGCRFLGAAVSPRTQKHAEPSGREVGQHGDEPSSGRHASVPAAGAPGRHGGGQLGVLGWNHKKAQVGWPTLRLWWGGSWRAGPQASPTAVLCFLAGIDYKTTTILLDGRRVKLELW